MDRKELGRVCDDHVAWIKGIGGSRADLCRANLSRADLYGADLSGAYLSGADLSGADLSGAYLSGADLHGANLRGADLYGADLSEANLSGADLYGADLRRANLRGTNLRRADLREAALPSPTMVLLAAWGTVSDTLTRDLMRYDAECHPEGGKAFRRWVDTDICPYRKCSVERAANFKERKSLWSAGPAPRPYVLMERLIAEKCRAADE